eukprot:12933376-Prorocentrum_lima.AAC.1
MRGQIDQLSIEHFMLTLLDPLKYKGNGTHVAAHHGSQCPTRRSTYDDSLRDASQGQVRCSQMHPQDNQPDSIWGTIEGNL